MTASWLESKHISRSEQAQYVKSGWLVRIDKGIYRLRSMAPTLFGSLASLKEQQAFNYRIGATSALDLQGYTHYITLGKPQMYLYTSIDRRLPKWMWAQEWGMDLRESCSKMFSGTKGVTQVETAGVSLAVSSPELAIMECLAQYPENHSLMDIYYSMESLTTLRPALVTKLLEECTSVKVKRLFLYMADKVKHPWFNRLDLSNVSLGRGPRSFAKGGVKIPKYDIIIPKELSRYDD